MRNEVTTLRYSPIAPLAGTSRLRRKAAYTQCLRCAGAPRRPASGSGLSLTIPAWHAALYDPGEFDAGGAATGIFIAAALAQGLAICAFLLGRSR
jgi:hypothetical protein